MKFLHIILHLVGYALGQTSTTTTTLSLSSSSSTSSYSTIQIFNILPTSLTSQTTTPTPSTTLATFDASIISASSSTTILAVTCNGACPIPSIYTITAAPSTYVEHGSFIGSANGLTVTTSQSNACNITSSTQTASCSVTIGYYGTVSGGQNSSSVVTSGTSYGSGEIWYMPVTVTAGAEKLAAATQTTGGGGGGSGSSSGGGRVEVGGWGWGWGLGVVMMGVLV
ncbi:uncharacterized protein BO88DRAFT_426919 [Aspergillus vadensis CBS 113365]|uniref:GPI anchored cell wall protein n=1 Tax=Aspergillus vadensis (strain CBS 113365 / IMI 142717 / IBT 24658) TaxID=1448311 RepID=A0A319B734_ASPVC|nr:hypothetical protein BO88DRAFT_426919 [Aspergillus vadensis CBS 113365]PYH67701.1 hypothetical protein BO88DRAFT_426919 [Aspergillus vadensis CBS 113365]